MGDQSLEVSISFNLQLLPTHLPPSPTSDDGRSLERA